MCLIDELIRDHSLTQQILDTVRLWISRDPPKETYWTGFKEFGKTIRLPRLNSYFKVDVVIWQEGHITIYPANYDSLSFKFSGCLMARFRIDNLYYIAHIHTSISKNDCRKQWTSFLYQFRDRIEELLIFKPGCNGTIKKGLDCWGLITRTGECYTLEVKRINKNRHRLIAIYKHYPATLSSIRDNRHMEQALSASSSHKKLAQIWNSICLDRAPHLVFKELGDMNTDDSLEEIDDSNHTMSCCRI